ncbi:AAA family ATPase [Clostridium grantii]|uniref:Stage 0 sporulation protein A homolog n=1 Tax=Clostridium grantii DSM 8605 TaxID=1121316 RepID=A0A1M5XCT5_9CLOT|nr:AAA family ATPase [Clostridium grantii]SHH97013.1 pilus assembly protein CpaE [Clostridium grantii DSM 8605]
MDIIKVFIADKNSDHNIDLRAYFSKSKRIEIVGECSDGNLVVKSCKEMKPDVAIIDKDLSGQDGFAITKILTSIMPNIIVIISCNKSGIDNMKSAMTSGARDLVEKPLNTHETLHKIISLYDNYKDVLYSQNAKDYNEIEVRNKIITIFSTKGGVGKTTLTSNIAVALSEKTKEKVVVLDFDFQFGDIPIMFDIYPRRTILDLYEDIDNLDGELIEEYLIEHPSGIKILPAPLNPEHADVITSNLIEKILKLLSDKYRYVVVDTAPIFNDINLATLDASDKILFVTTLDLSTIKNVKLGLQVMKKLDYEEGKVCILLNRYHKNFGITKLELEKSVNKKILFTISEDAVVATQAMNKGVPFVLSHRRSKITKQLMVAVDNIIADKTARKKVFLHK